MIASFRALSLVSIAAVGALVACSPCAGTSPCDSDTPKLVMNGQIVDVLSGRGVDGIPVDVIRFDGAVTRSDTLSTTTADGGFWHVEATTNAPGDIVLSVRVHTPELANPYVLGGIHVPTQNRRGEAFQFGRTIANPYYDYYLYLVDATTNAPFPSTPIHFHQRSGPRMTGLDANGDITMTSDPYGVAQLFLFNTFATDTGAVVLDAIAELPEPYGQTPVSGIVLIPNYNFREDGPYVVVRVSPRASRDARPSIAYRRIPALAARLSPGKVFLR